MKQRRTTSRTAPGQNGFTLIEVLISIVILTIGMLSLLTALCYAMAASQVSQQNMIARQLASEAMESVFTARNDSQLSWAQVNNVSQGGIFIDGATPLLCAGPDGILGTADDTPCTTILGAECPNGGVQCLDEAGPDGKLGDADDVIVSLANYTRTIQISPMYAAGGTLIPTLRAVTITINYTVAQQTSVPRTYSITEYISSYH
jgi:prepilin-type N-terminal cleavage/methylation domain-containing protein